MTIIAHPSGDKHYSRLNPELVLRGVNAPGAKLSATQIAEICAFYDDGATMPELARAYGVSRITVWRHLKARDVSREKVTRQTP